jgi:hypothetical protein
MSFPMSFRPGAARFAFKVFQTFFISVISPAPREARFLRLGRLTEAEGCSSSVTSVLSLFSLPGFGQWLLL